MREEGYVSLCSADQCLFNQDNQCHADSVEISTHSDHADCSTFTCE